MNWGEWKSLDDAFPEIISEIQVDCFRFTPIGETTYFEICIGDLFKRRFVQILEEIV